MDNILARNSVDATPTVAVTMVASQQQRARRKAAMSADAAREDLMLAPDDDDNNNNFEGAGGCPQASAAASVNHKRLFNPRASLNVGQSPPVAAAVAQRLNGFSSSFSSSVPAVSNSCAGSSDARGDYGSSASGGNSNGKHDSNSNSHNSKKKTALSAHAVEYLKNWMMSPDHIDHPYPTEDEKLRIMNETGIVLKQLTNWFVNNRKRYWKPKVEELKRRQSGDTGGGAGEGAGSPQETAEVSVDQGGGGVAATTMTVAMRKKNVDGKDGGESSQSQREEVNRRPPPSILSSGNVGGGKRRKKNPTPASDDDDNTSNDDASARRAKKAREEVARYPTITNPMMPMITATVASTSAGVATDASHESVQAQSRMKMTRTYANCSHTSVVSEESAEEGRGADGGGEGGGGSGTEDENGDDTYEVRNVAVSDSLLVNDTHAFVTSADARSLPPSLNAINSKSGLLQASHQQVMMMIDMEYSINPLDMDDSDDDLIQNNTSVERTICCSSVLPHSCTDPKVRFLRVHTRERTFSILVIFSSHFLFTLH